MVICIHITTHYGRSATETRIQTMLKNFTKAGISATLRHAGFKSITLANPTVGFHVTPNLTVTVHLPKAEADQEKATLAQLAVALRAAGAKVKLDGDKLRVKAA